MMKSVCLVAAALLIAAAPAPGPRYAVAGSIAGPDGPWDYASVDPGSDQLLVARGSGVTLFKIGDPASPRQIGVTERSHAALALPGTGLILVTSGRDDSVRLIDSHSGAEKARIAVGKGPDAAVYDAPSHSALVMNAKGGTVSVIDIAAQRVARTIVLKPGLEFAVTDGHGTLFVNNEEANEIETADIASGKAGAAIPLPGCTEPSGLGFDPATGRLVSACANGKAAVVDAVRRQFVGLLDIGSGADATIIDSARRLAFIPCGRSATLAVIALGDRQNPPVVVESIPTEPGARTGALDPRDGAIYLPTARFGPAPAGGGRPPAVPGSFHVIVVRPQP